MERTRRQVGSLYPQTYLEYFQPLGLVTPPPYKCSLAATIKAMRPELLPHIPTVGVDAIPEDMPSIETKQAPVVEGIGQPTTACFFTRQGVDPTGW